MSKISYALALPLVAVGAFAWLPKGEAMSQQTSKGVSCEIRSEAVSGGVALAATAAADRPASGAYEFIVSKSGAAGTSNTAQSGDFELGSGEDAVLSEVTLGVDSGSRYVAELRLTFDGGTVFCRQAYPQT